jgi:hypothetical protein
MDLVSHGLWGSVVTRKKSVYLGFLFGILPDILSMGWYFGPKPYLIAHSLLGLLVVALITRAAFHTWTYAGAYFLHIFFDVLVHNRGTSTLFYVPFLWKSYDTIGFHGWNWWHDGFFLEIINWMILIPIITVIYVRKHRNLKDSTTNEEKSGDKSNL